MKVVFLSEVVGVAELGQVKDVAPGYARNYLFPQKLAVPASKDALAQVESRKAAEQRRQAKLASDAQKLGAELEKVTITIKARVGEENRLYGSVTNSDIAEALEKQTGHVIDKRKIELEEPLKRAGSFEVPVHLATNVVSKLTVAIEPE